MTEEAMWAARIELERDELALKRETLEFEKARFEHQKQMELAYLNLERQRKLPAVHSNLVIKPMEVPNEGYVVTC
jgi:hypothetical protein